MDTGLAFRPVRADLTARHSGHASVKIRFYCKTGNFMTYMLLILEPTEQRSLRTEAEGRAVYDRMLRFADGLKSQGLLLGAESLASHASAARVRVQRGQSHVIDGPFAEAKEMVGGFFLLDCATREEAIAIAAQCPAAEWCTVEVRSLAPCYEA
jgi:hypothetical protein